MNALSPAALLDSTALSQACLSQDAAIIALSRQLLAGERRLADWDASRCELDPEEASALTLETSRQATMLMTMRPASLTALAAKVEAFRLSFNGTVANEPGETVESMGEYPHQLAWSVFQDVLRLAAAPSPDAALLAAAADYKAFEATMPQSTGQQKVYGTPECKAFEASIAEFCSKEAVLFEAFMRIPAFTMQGLRAKALAGDRWDRQEDSFGALVEDLTRVPEVGVGLGEIKVSPDAPLIAACEEFLRIDREFSAFCQARGDEELERDSEVGLAMLAPQKALAEQIVAARATTAEGHLARLRIIAFGILPKNSQCQDVPGAAMVDRLRAATLRDLVAMERGSGA